MKLGNNKLYFSIFIFFFIYNSNILAIDKIESVPLINLEELSPTFEEEKDELEKIDDQNNSLNIIENTTEEKIIKKNDKIYINIKALDKVTAKTSDIRLARGEKKFFGSLEIKGLKCQLSEDSEFIDTVAYLQVKD